MVDRIINMRGDESAIGIKNVTANEPQFLGHFPGNPVFPGVLLIEGMAQTAGAVCVLSQMGGDRPKHVYFLTIDKAKFRKPVVPGDTDRISRDQNRAEKEHVVVPRRGKGRRTDGRRGGSRRHGRVRSAWHDRSNRAHRAGRGDRARTRRSGPYCVVGPPCGDRRRLPAGGSRSCHRPHHDRARAPCFIRLPRSGRHRSPVKYRGGPTRLVVGADCDIREGVTDEHGNRGRWRRHRGRRSLLSDGGFSRRPRLPWSATT